jgi:glycosyltransferase involved in cell wall biosynthesis
LEEASGEWVLYLDADERITPLLKDEITEKINNLDSSVYAIPRKNYLLGKELHFGGWYPDYQIRLFQKSKLHKWVGDLHEHPEFEGTVEKLKNPMIHLQPEKIEPALKKSIKWSGVEANLLFGANHPKIVWWRVLRMGLTTIFDRLIKKQGFRDGTEGWIESVYQSFHTMIVYMKLWELQNTEKK